MSTLELLLAHPNYNAVVTGMKSEMAYRSRMKQFLIFHIAKQIEVIYIYCFTYTDSNTKILSS